MADRDLIDHFNQVRERKEDGYWESLDAAERREWSSWVIHRFFSMSTDYLPIVNEVQDHLIGLDDRLVYEFWKNATPPDPRFPNYIKADASEGGVPEWLLELLRDHYEISNEEAREYITVFLSDDDRVEALRDLVRKYGMGEDRMDELEEMIDGRR